jgi:hypothetical protein
MTAGPSSTRLVDAAPQPAALVEGLRDMGYSLATALADIIDNSITARARTVQLVAETSHSEPFIALIDDGCGMAPGELVQAMRLGSKDPRAPRGQADLGRFGLGLKSASFSQCRRLVVATRHAGVSTVAVWDLDDVSRRNTWELEIHDQLEGLPGADLLGPTGTLVLWQKLDRPGGRTQARASPRVEEINRQLGEAERHLRMVFHRFIDRAGQLTIYFNGRQLEPLDPLALAHAATVRTPEEEIDLGTGVVRIQAVTIPHESKAGRRLWEDLAGPDGTARSQGIYVYRGDRLIIHGGWQGLSKSSPLTQLARLRVDIPNSMDADWTIDVKKSSAQLPVPVRTRLRELVDRIVQGSRRTYDGRGQRLVDRERFPLWRRYVTEGVGIRYAPNTEHPMLSGFRDQLPAELQRQFDQCVRVIGAALPIETLFTDLDRQEGTVTGGDLCEDDILVALMAVIRKLPAEKKRTVEVEKLLRDTEPFRRAWATTERLIQDARAGGLIA